jgi:hypothetical protein
LLSRWNKRLHGKFTPAMNNKKPAASGLLLARILS